MTIERKVGMGIAGQPSGGPTDVADVFSTYLYTGTEASNHVINNGIDLDGEGGMVWIKNRSSSAASAMLDTERGLNKISSSTTAGQASSTDFSSFNSNGFTLGWNSATENGNSAYVSWTFRKKEKFFDIQTYNGTGSAGLSVAHDLNVIPAFMLVKVYAGGTANWYAWSNQINSGNNYAHLNRDGAWETDAINIFGNGSASVPPTDTHFTIGGYSAINSSGKTYVAYLFADNSSEDADDQMIKCGSYAGTGNSDVVINLGWEPQFVLIKNYNLARNWVMFDSMRGVHTEGNASELKANEANAESTTSDALRFNSLGFELDANATADLNRGGDSCLYMAIRAPMMVEPEAATNVFAIDTRGSSGDGKRPSYRLGSPVDMLFVKNIAQSNGTYIGSRLQGPRYMLTQSNQAEAAYGDYKFDYPNGVGTPTNTDSNEYAWMWKRAKGFFDVVTYKGDTNSGRTVAHSLGVVPEMIWVKCRTDTTSWMVYHKELTAYKYLVLNTNAGPVTHNGNWYNTNPTDSVFTVGDGATNVAQTQVAFLFASLAGISKVGSFSGSTGNVVNVECGFAPRLVLIKKSNGTGNWLLFDTVRGIVSGNDAKIHLDVTDAQNSATDYIDPYGTGFSLSLDTEINENGKSFIFYAIA